MKLFNLFKNKSVVKEEPKPEPKVETSIFMTAPEMDALTPDQYWKKIDEYGAKLLVQTNTEFTNGHKPAIDALMTAAALIAVKVNLPFPTFMEAIMNNYLGVAKISGEDLMSNLLINVPKPLDKSQLN
jgi:hypothetical protein